MGENVISRKPEGRRRQGTIKTVHNVQTADNADTQDTTITRRVVFLFKFWTADPNGSKPPSKQSSF